jgi:hypothetical protein
MPWNSIEIGNQNAQILAKRVTVNRPKTVVNTRSLVFVFSCFDNGMPRLIAVKRI